jgi:hypothetical protein
MVLRIRISDLLRRSMDVFTQMVAYSFNADVASWSPPDVAASIASNAIVAAVTDRVFPAGMRAAEVESGKRALTQTVVGPQIRWPIK